MAFDGLFTRAMTNELQVLTSGRITKIHQPNQLEIMLQIRAAGANYKLLISIHPSYARIHLTDHSVENPAEPPMFCMLMRKHIEGGFIQSIEQNEFERIITFTIESTNEIGDKVTRKLIIEIMGRHSNCILTDAANDQIIDSLKHLPPSVNSYRTVLPGQSYIAPPSQHKKDPLTLQTEEVKALIQEENQASAIIQTIAGISPLHANELIARLTNGESYEAYVKQLTNNAMPNYTEVNGKGYFSSAELKHLYGTI